MIIFKPAVVILGGNREKLMQALKMCFAIKDLDGNARKWAEKKMLELRSFP